MGPARHCRRVFLLDRLSFRHIAQALETVHFLLKFVVTLSLAATAAGLLMRLARPALAANGVTPDMVVGSSVGALNAAYYASAPTAEGVERLAKIWLGLRGEDVFPVTWRTMLSLLLRRDFLVSADGLRWLVDSYLPYRNLEDAKLPVHVVATDILTGELVVLSKGSASQAIPASAAIPAFPPFLLERRYLADGAIKSSTPAMVAVGLGARRLVVLPTRVRLCS